MGRRVERDVFVVKYALTKGIFALRGTVSLSGFFRGGGYFLSSKEYALTKKEAVGKAEEMREKKLQALSRAKARVSELDFDAMIIKVTGA